MAQSVSVGIVPRGNYDFRGLRDGSIALPIAQRIDVASADSLALELWIHDGHFPKGSRVTLLAASDGASAEAAEALLQTRTAAGEPIAAFVIDSRIALPSFHLIPVPAAQIGRLFALVLEATGGKEGAHVSFTIDLLIREATLSEPVIEPIVTTTPEREDEASSAALGRIAAAAQRAVARRPLKRYPRWREIVV